MRKIIGFCLALVVLVIPFLSKADGMVLPPPDYYVQETAQEAVIVHKDGQEDLIVSIQFEGDVDEFAWIIPTPSKPEVSKSTDELFTSLEDFTGYTSYDYDDYAAPMAAKSGVAEESVTVVERKKVDVYDTVVLKATNADDLAKWLNDNKFVYPKDEAFVFEDYIDKSWYFVAAKINAKYLNTSASSRLKSGHATPLKLSFATDKIVFPLRISSIQQEKKLNVTALDEKGEAVEAIDEDTGEELDLDIEASSFYDYYTPPESVSITLYIFSDHKKTIPGFSTNYASYVDPVEIKDFAMVEGESWFEPQDRMYLTKLYRYMAVSEMTDDLYPRDAKDNKAVGNVTTQGSIFLEIALIIMAVIFGFIFSPFGILFIVGSFMHFGKKKGTQVTAWIFQWIGVAALLVTEVIVAIYYGLEAADLTKTSGYNFIAAIASMGFLLLVCLLVMVIQAIVLRKRKAKVE